MAQPAATGAPQRQHTRRLFVLMAILAFLLVPLIYQQVDLLYAREDPPLVSILTNRTDPVYQIGEEVQFLIQVKDHDQIVTRGTFRYVIDDSGPNEFARGTAVLSDEPTVLTATMDRPGFLRCRVSYANQDFTWTKTSAAAAISPLDIQPSLPVPNDFDAFWSQQKRSLAQVPMNATFELVETKDEIECFDVKVDCLGNAPVRGYLARPREAKPKSLPAVVWPHGAGVRSSSVYQAIQGARLNALSFDFNAHGIPNGRPREFYKKLENGKLIGYRLEGRESRETYYFLGIYLRLMRAIDFVTSQPEWDGKTLVVMGYSQGGGLALVAGGLDERITLIGAGNAAMCDHSAAVVNRVVGWPQLVPIDANGKPNPTILKASRYFDAVNFASRCKAEAILGVGFLDDICPPTGLYAAYNQLRGPKEIIHAPFGKHEVPFSTVDAFVAKLKKHLKRNSEH